MRSSSALFVLAACSSSPSSSTTTPPLAQRAPPDAQPPDSPAPPPSIAIDAAAEFERKGCNACHTLDGTTKYASSIKGIFGKSITLTDGTTAIVDERYIREALTDPSAQVQAGFPIAMPSYAGVFSDAELDAMVAWIKSLR